MQKKEQGEKYLKKFVANKTEIIVRLHKRHFKVFHYVCII